MNSSTNTASTAPLIPTADPSPKPYEVVRFNALKHGILSRYTVLSHENHADYESLVNSLMDEHLPAGATEQHLIEELASVIWRKRRVLQAEGATINKGLKESARSAKTVIPAAAPFEMGLSGEHTDIRDLMDLKPADVAESHQSAKHDIDATDKASAILRLSTSKKKSPASTTLSLTRPLARGCKPIGWRSFPAMKQTSTASLSALWPC